MFFFFLLRFFLFSSFVPSFRTFSPTERQFPRFTRAIDYEFEGTDCFTAEWGSRGVCLFFLYKVDSFDERLRRFFGRMRIYVLFNRRSLKEKFVRYLYRYR